MVLPLAYVILTGDTSLSLPSILTETHRVTMATMAADCWACRSSFSLLHRATGETILCRSLVRQR